MFWVDREGAGREGGATTAERVYAPNRLHSKLFTPNSYPMTQLPPCGSGRLRRIRNAAGLLVSCLALFAGPTELEAQEATGTVTGRVFNAVSGRSMSSARVFVGDQRTVATDDFGGYRVSGVPAGPVRVVVQFTGFSEESYEVIVPAGGVVEADFALRGMASQSAGAEVIDLEEYVVVSREVDAMAMALQEQRYSANIKNVVDADAFGDVTEGNVGEFIKYLPGVSVDYVAADVRTISVRGMGSNFTPVSVDGNRMASASSSEANRAFELEQVSMNNVARIELHKAPTPAMPADSMGGSVNLVSKNAFERRRAEFKYRTALSINDGNINWGRTPGPGAEDTWKIRPGFDFTYTNPLSKDFGFVVTGLSSDQYTDQHRTRMRYAPSNLAGVPPIENSYLRRYEYQDGPKATRRKSGGLSADWRVRPGTVLTFSTQLNTFDGYFYNRLLTFDANQTSIIRSPTEILGGLTNGSVLTGGSTRLKTGETHHSAIGLKHVGDNWHFDGGVSYSISDSKHSDTENGHFQRVQAILPSVQVGFQGITAYQPTNIVVQKTTAGVTTPVDWTNLTNYRLRDARSQPFQSEDQFMSGNFNVRRDFKGLAVPFSLQTGLAVRRQERDIRKQQFEWEFRGPDGFGNTGDEIISGPGGLIDIADRGYVGQAPGWGWPAQQWPDVYRAYQLLQSQPSWWKQINEENSVEFNVTNSAFMRETVTATYLQGETSLMDGRLKLLGGVRFERTELYGEGFTYDKFVNNVRDANGNLVRDAAGQYVQIDNTLDSVQLRRLQYTERNARAQRSYQDYYPSIHLTYDLRKDLVLRMSYANTLGRPNFSEIVPGVRTEDNDAGQLRIDAPNPGLLPRNADNFDISLEFYTRPAGVISIGLFQKNISNFFGRVVIDATPELLAELGLGNEWLTYIPPGETEPVPTPIFTTINAGDAKVRGIELNFNQQLTMLPEWARGFSVYANGTWLSLDGSSAADFNEFIKQTGNWGVTFARGPLDIKLKWNYRGGQQIEPLTPPYEGWFYFDSRTFLDLNIEYRFSRRLTAFLNGRNIRNKPQERLMMDGRLPVHAQHERREEFGVQWALGVKGTF